MNERQTIPLQKLKEIDERVRKVRGAFAQESFPPEELETFAAVVSPRLSEVVAEDEEATEIMLAPEEMIVYQAVLTYFTRLHNLSQDSTS